jgi:hypothetical protein
MDVRDAVQRAETLSDVTARKRRGFYLSSALALTDDLKSVGEWTLAYFNPATRKVFSVKVGDTVAISDESEPLVDAHYAELDFSSAAPTDELLEATRARVGRERLKVLKTVIALREGEWKAAIFTPDFRVARLDLSLNDAKTLRFDVSNLLKTL